MLLIICGTSSGQCNSLQLDLDNHGIIVAVVSAFVRATRRLLNASLIDWCISPTLDNVSLTVTLVLNTCWYVLVFCLSGVVSLSCPRILLQTLLFLEDGLTLLTCQGILTVVFCTGFFVVVSFPHYLVHQPYEVQLIHPP